MSISTLKENFSAGARLVYLFREFSSTAPSSRRSDASVSLSAAVTALLFPSFFVIHLKELGFYDCNGDRGREWNY
jgi:hypothetical protein